MQTVDLISPLEQHEPLDQAVNSGANYFDEKDSRKSKFTQRPKPRSHKLWSTLALITSMKRRLEQVNLPKGQIPEVVNSSQI